MSTATVEPISALERWINKRRLREVRRVGAGARLEGGADVGGGGEITIGTDFFLLSRPVRSHIFAGPGAFIAIADGVRISYGAAISAWRAVEIGSNTSIGPFVVIMDNDFHRVGNRHAAPEIAPVRIGSNVKIGARVTILRGSVIGDNVCIKSGSMVSGFIPGGVTIGGVPARVVVSSHVGVSNSVDMAKLVQSVLGLSARPQPDEGPSTLAAWDSLGTLRLLLAIEETYGLRIDEAEMRAATTVAALAAIVAAKRTGSVHARCRCGGTGAKRSGAGRAPAG